MVSCAPLRDLVWPHPPAKDFSPRRRPVEAKMLPKEDALNSPRRIVIYKFHSEPELCRSRVAQLRELNPGVPVFGMWGGALDQLEHVATGLDGAFDHLHGLRVEDPWLKWSGADFCLRDWFHGIGNTVDFDVAHVIEWDLLLLAPLAEIYAQVPPGAVGLSGLTRLAAIEDRWFWTTNSYHAPAWPRLRAHAEAALGWRGEPMACVGPGPCFPRAFLERLAELELTAHAHDELRLPLLAQALGFPLADTGFYRRWFDPEDELLFNCEGVSIEPARILAELLKPGGRRAFHPVREPFRIHLLESDHQRQPRGSKPL